MANYCDYEIRVKGSKNATLLVFASMPCCDYKEMQLETGNPDNHEIRFKGNCKWSVNYGVTDVWDRERLDIQSLDEKRVMQLGNDLWNYSLRVKSEVCRCEIQVHYWSEESEFDQFDQYIDGECIKKRKIAYNYDLYNKDDFEEFTTSSECDPTNQVYDVCHIQENNRNQNIESVRQGDSLDIKLSCTEDGRRGIEVFSKNGLTLGYLLFPDDVFMDNIDDYDAKVESVEPLSERKKKSGRCRVALLSVRLTIKPEKKASFDKEAAAEKDNKDTEDGAFDWNSLEFIGHEGEYDESVDGEEQNENLMAMLTGATKMFGAREPDVEKETQEALNELGAKLVDLLNQLEGVAAETGINLHDSSIGDTGYDLYNWTFSEGKRQEGPGWSVAIPDGFEIVDSKENRVFEAAPKGMSDLDDYEVPVRILPGVEQASAIDEDLWMFHPLARAGIAAHIGTELANVTQELSGLDIREVYSVGFADICAYAILQETGGSSYSIQCIEATDSKSQMLRVQTQYITDEQKEILIKSILEWLQTFKFDEPNGAIPSLVPFELPEVVDELREGKEDLFNAAVDKAQREYYAAYNGKLSAVQYCAQNGMSEDTLCKSVKEFLKQSLEVKQFYFEKADNLVEKLKGVQIAAKTMKSVYTKLKDMDSVKTELEVNDKTVSVEVPARIEEIQKKWSAEAASLERQEKDEAERKRIEAETRREEELANYEKEIASWRAKCEDIKAQRERKVKELIQQEETSLKINAEKKRDTENAANQAVIDEQTQRKVDAEKTLATLGVFKVAERKAQKAIIEEAEKRIAAAKSAISKASGECLSSVSSAYNEAKKKENEIRKIVESEIKLPAEPQKPDLTKYEKKPETIEERKATREKRKKELKNTICECLGYWEQYTVEEVLDFLPEGVSRAEVSGLLFELVSEGRVVRTVEKRIPYYSLS